MKTFRMVNTVAIVLTLSAALLSLIGLFKTGFYPGVIVLCCLPFIPFASRALVRRSGHTHVVPFALNIVVILIVLWMSFVVLHDRVLGDCC